MNSSIDYASNSINQNKVITLEYRKNDYNIRLNRKLLKLNKSLLREMKQPNK